MAFRVDLHELNLPDFFLAETNIIEKQLVEDLHRHESGQPTLGFKIQELPTEIETVSFPGYRSYYTYVDCNTNYVSWGTCIIEIHFKDECNYQMFVIA